MQGETIQSDCVIVGAGLVGTILSIALSSQGLNITLIEREKTRPQALKDARSLVLSAGTVGILESIDAWSAISSLCTPIEKILVTEKGVLPRVTLKAIESGLDVLGYSCPAHLLLDNLRKKAFSCNRLRFLDGTEFRGMRLTKSGVEAELYSSDGHVGAEARLIVAADGANSDVRRVSGISVDKNLYNEVALVCKISVSNPTMGMALERFTEQGVLAFIPVGGRDYVSVCCLSDSESMSVKELDSKAYASLLEERLGGYLGVLQVVGARYSYPLLSQRALSLRADRLLLVGNAANVVHPNAAQGLNLGIRDVADLASLIDCNVADIGCEQILSQYTKLRHKDHETIHTFTDSLGGIFTSKMTPFIFARRVAMLHASRSAAFRRKIVASSTGTGALFHRHR
jgi:2-octaprenyl-6-methoxyphenol hydroxylase